MRTRTKKQSNLLASLAHAFAAFGAVAALGFAAPSTAQTLTTIDFEGLADGTLLGLQFPGLQFSNAAVLASGLSLNEFEFPPRSGDKVASDDQGFMQLVFDVPVSSVAGYFTYSVPLQLTASDAGGTVVASAVSSFSSNLLISGVAGSAPNERITLSFASGITRLVIAGDPAGGSFVMDDLAVSPVPEPAGALLLMAGLVALSGVRRARSLEVLS